MDKETFFIAAFIGASYVAWPNLAKALNVKPGLVAFIVIVVALVVIVLIAPRDIVELPKISIKPLIVVLSFAIANGIAIYLQSSKAADKDISTGTFLATLFILQVCFAPFAEWIVTGLVPNWRQVAGYGLAIAGMWLIPR